MESAEIAFTLVDAQIFLLKMIVLFLLFAGVYIIAGKKPGFSAGMVSVSIFFAFIASILALIDLFI